MSSLVRCLTNRPKGASFYSGLVLALFCCFSPSLPLSTALEPLLLFAIAFAAVSYGAFILRVYLMSGFGLCMYCMCCCLLWFWDADIEPLDTYALPLGWPGFLPGSSGYCRRELRALYV
jgi:hypothetical protein